jgi:hypothetical protein
MFVLISISVLSTVLHEYGKCVVCTCARKKLYYSKYSEIPTP